MTRKLSYVTPLSSIAFGPSKEHTIAGSAGQGAPVDPIFTVNHAALDSTVSYPVAEILQARPRFHSSQASDLRRNWRRIGCREAFMLATKHLISISNGSACTSHSYQPSHVLQAIGLAPDRIQSSLRLSRCHFTDRSSVAVSRRQPSPVRRSKFQASDRFEQLAREVFLFHEHFNANLTGSY